MASFILTFILIIMIGYGLFKDSACMKCNKANPVVKSPTKAKKKRSTKK